MHDLSHQLDAAAADVFADHEQWITDRQGDGTFSYVHLADPHIPVTPPSEYWNKHDGDTSIENLENWEYERTVEPDDPVERYREHRWRLSAPLPSTSTTVSRHTSNRFGRRSTT